MEQLKQWRIERNLSADEAGALFGVSRVQWFRIESGARQVAANKTLDFERLTGISRHKLRPDIFGPAPKRGAAA